MSDEQAQQPLDKDDPNYGTVDDPGFEDPYAHLRDKEKELGGPVEETETTTDDIEGHEVTGDGTDAPDASGTGGDQAGL